MAYELSPNESRLVEYLEDRLSQPGGAPSYEEMRRALALSSKDHVSRLLEGLEEGGYVQRERNRSRSLVLLRSSDGRPFHLSRTVRVPVLAVAPASFGQVQADGFEPESYIELTRELVPDDAGIYALQVRGDSMIDAFINEGDIVVLRQQGEVHNGDLAQVWVQSEESATLKRYFREGKRICLRPENPTMQPRYYPEEDIQVQGKVILVIRQLEKRLAA